MPNGVVDLAGRCASVRNVRCPVLGIPAGAFARSFLLASAAAIVSVSAAAQTSPQSPLPAITVDAPQQKRAAAARPPQRSGARAARVSRVSNPAAAAVANDLARGPALTVLTVQQALRDIQQTPGGVAIVPAEAYRNSTVANTIKDVLDYVPGVFAQPKWGDDTRLSIRGSGLSRNFHLRGVQLYMDGIPINTADGYGDFQEIDPTAYKYVAVYKGANALQFGANSLGGAINFVMPTGRDPFPNGVSPTSAASGFAACRPTRAAPTAHGTASSPHPHRRRRDSGITALGKPHASAAMSAISSRLMSRPGFT